MVGKNGKLNERIEVSALWSTMVKSAGLGVPTRHIQPVSTVVITWPRKIFNRPLFYGAFQSFPGRLPHFLVYLGPSFHFMLCRKKCFKKSLKVTRFFI